MCLMFIRTRHSYRLGVSYDFELDIKQQTIPVIPLVEPLLPPLTLMSDRQLLAGAQLLTVIRKKSIAALCRQEGIS